MLTPLSILHHLSKFLLLGLGPVFHYSHPLSFTTAAGQHLPNTL